MKTIFIIFMLILTLNISGQVYPYDPNYINPTEIEGIIGGIMTVSIFPAVNEMDRLLYSKYMTKAIPNESKYINQRAMFAFTCMTTTVGTYYLIKYIREKKKKRN